jgi:hypothetical protein
MNATAARAARRAVPEEILTGPFRISLRGLVHGGANEDAVSLSSVDHG